MSETVERIIKEIRDGEYENALKDASWEVYRELSPLRECVLNWYPFDKQRDFLVISSGYGALVGLFCRKGRRVVVLEESSRRAHYIRERYRNEKNLTVLTGKPAQAFFEGKFDYVYVEEMPENAVKLDHMLMEVQPYLKENGRLLFVCENRFGMRSWCGVPDTVSRIPFAALRGTEGTGLLTKADLIGLLKRNSWIGSYRLYYPFPDAFLTQAVYTDEYLPERSIRDRVIPYYTEEQKQCLVCLENEISDKLIENRVFSVFANSFLVECSPKDFQEDVIFAALSLDRGRKNGFATVIRADKTVQKQILYPEGKECLRATYDNQKELIDRGIACVPQIWKERSIEMPFVEEKPLIKHLKEQFVADRKKVDSIFEQLYANILRSSEGVDFKDCALKGSTLTEQNAGTVLKRAYLDMIPYNCFWRDGEIVFYDQEFVKENYPAKYVLFRALRYTYEYIPEAEKLIPLQHYKEKFGLSELWELFEKEEAAFIEKNRNYEIYSSFYGWASVSKERVTRNNKKLMQEAGAEKKEGGQEEKSKESGAYYFPKRTYTIDLYKRDYRLNEIKKVQMELLKELDRVCTQMGLAYCAFYGTLLGCVRHKGYVPWDDDMDVAMSRHDYDKLVEQAPQLFREQYFLQTPENDEGCFYGGYSKLRDSTTTGLEERNKGNRCHQGIWIDIFPLDNIPQNMKEKERQSEKIRFYQRLLIKRSYPDKRMLWDLSEREEEDYCRLGAIFTRQELCERLHETLADKRYEDSPRVAVMTRYQPCTPCTEYERNDFEYLINMPFEDFTVPVPVGYEACLKADYGDDYCLYPAVADRKPHHRAWYDVKKPYTEYLNIRKEK